MSYTRPVTVIGLSGRSASMSVNRFARGGETILGRDLIVESGGKGYNQAIGLTRLGVETTYISIIGQDDNGRLCREDLLREGVSHAHFIECTKASTSFAAILRDQNGENTVALYPGVSDLFSPADVDSFSDCIAQSRYLLLSLELPVPAVARAVDIAMRSGTKVVLNPAPARPLPAETLRDSYLLTPNETEALFMLGVGGNDSLSPIELLSAWRNKALGSGVVTLGALGALVIGDETGNAYLVQAPKVRPVDTTGAGDTFNAALTAMLVKGYALLESAKRAVFLSSLSVCTRGVLASIPRSEDLQSYREPIVQKLEL